MFTHVRQPEVLVFDGPRVAIEVDRTVHGVDAILRTAYRFTDRCYVFISSDGARPRVVHAILQAKRPGLDAAGLQALAGEFANELIDQAVRESLAAEFADVRNMIVAQAFSDSNLLDPDRDDGDYRSDPRGARTRR